MKTAVALLHPAVPPLAVQGQSNLQIVQRKVQFPHEAAISGLRILQGDAGGHGAGVEELVVLRGEHFKHLLEVVLIEFPHDHSNVLLVFY